MRKADNGSEFIAKSLDGWAYFNDVQLDYSRPGTPTDNACIESFNGSFRDECLNTNWFMSLEDAKEKIEAWKNDISTNFASGTTTGGSTISFGNKTRHSQSFICVSGANTTIFFNGHTCIHT